MKWIHVQIIDDEFHVFYIKQTSDQACIQPHLTLMSGDLKSNKKKKIQRIVAGATNKKSITKSHMLVKLNSGVNGAPTDGA